jgi:hypothetical protein
MPVNGEQARDVMLNRLRRHEFIIYILIGFASDYIEMYIKPNTTAEVVCPYKENQKAPIIWRNSNKIIGYGNIVGDREGKFTISNNNGTGKSMLEIVNFSVPDEDMYRCIGNHGKGTFEIYFNIHICGK